MADIGNAEEAEIILKDLLSDTERQVIAKRLAICIFLDKNRSYENVKETLKVSSATIASMHEKMGNLGIQKALQKVKAEAWADEWSQKLSRFVNKLVPSK